MLLVHSVGAVTPVGLDAAQTCAALRARLSGVEAILAQAPPNDALLAAAVPARSDLKRRADFWLAHLALRALRECIANYKGDLSRLALFLALPEPFREHPALADATGQQLSARIVAALGANFSPHSRVLNSGHAAVAEALRLVSALVEKGSIDGALLGGVDSLLFDADLDRLRGAGRLHLPGHPFAVIPGEGAAFFLVGGDARPLAIPPMACLPGFATTREVDSICGHRYSVGIGMQDALAAALAQAGQQEGAIGWRITDVNGERYRTWEASVFVTRAYRSLRDGLPCVHLPAATGDLGAATQALQVIFAATAMMRGYAPAPLAVCEAASEDGLRGACLVAPAPGELRPPFRSARRGADRAARAVIMRQAERVPHELSALVDQRASRIGGAMRFKDLEWHDERIDSMLDLLRSYGRSAWAAIAAAVDAGDRGAFFARGVLTLECGQRERIANFAEEALLAVAERPLLAALGWVSRAFLQGVAMDFARSSSPSARGLATSCFSLHRVAGCPLLPALLRDDDPGVRARALRLIGDVGEGTYFAAAREAMAEPLTAVRFWAARSSVLLGDRGAGIDTLASIAHTSGPLAAQAMSILLSAANRNFVRAFLRSLAKMGEGDPSARRKLVVGCGMSGDPHYVPWLIGLMSDDGLARAAGEAFSFVTGADIAALDLERKPPENFASGPNDNPEDEDVAVDEDEGLPWPDQAKVQAWWSANSQRFEPGIRYFVGAPPSWAHCIEVLKTGYQRQRFAAAQHLCLLRPGTPLFNCAAPAWRQQRLLARMS